MTNYKICSVVVTYNRKELLIRNIKSIMSQSIKTDIIIYDNASTDGTYEFLEEKGILKNDNVRYIKSSNNLGGAGGFCNGEKAAIERDYDFIWLMDDDGYCINEHTLEKKVDLSKNRIYNSYVICDDKKNTPTFGLGPYKTDEDVQKAAKNDVVYGQGNAYNGTLVPTECFKKVGFTDERFFIYGDEADFFYRSNKAGYEWVTPIRSLYYHPVNRNVKKCSFFGIKYEVKDQPIWKLYLETRNTRYIGIKHFDTKTSLKHYIKAFLISIRSNNKRFKRVYYSMLALQDANNEYFDREIMFKA